MLYANDNGDLTFTGEMKFENINDSTKYALLKREMDGESVQMSAILNGDSSSRFRFLYQNENEKKELGFFGSNGLQVDDNFTLYSTLGNTWYWNKNGYLYPKIDETGYLGLENNAFKKVFTNAVGNDRSVRSTIVEGTNVFIRSEYNIILAIILSSSGWFLWATNK